MAGLGDTRSKPVGTPFCRCPCPPAVPGPGPLAPLPLEVPQSPVAAPRSTLRSGDRGAPLGAQVPCPTGTQTLGTGGSDGSCRGPATSMTPTASLPKTCPSCPGQRFAGWVTAETPQSRGAEVPGDPLLPPNPSPAAAPGGTGPVPRSGARGTGTHCAPHWDGGTHRHGAGTGTTRSSEEAPDALPSTLSRGIR